MAKLRPRGAIRHSSLLRENSVSFCGRRGLQKRRERLAALPVRLLSGWKDHRAPKRRALPRKIILPIKLRRRHAVMR